MPISPLRCFFHADAFFALSPYAIIDAAAATAD